MEITEVRVFLKDGQDKKLKAYATVTFDNCFVVRNIKVIHSANGLFIAMPSRKMKFSCPKCNFKNEMGSKFCNHCGATLPVVVPDATAKPKDAKTDHRDIAHPVTKEFRDYLQKKVLDAYEQQAVKGDSSEPQGIKGESLLKDFGDGGDDEV
ncbi:MAG: septation protein SpoVG family protein [Candidatus Omnitrophica bacterium]|nr:septation protein SpoVG family protein [Candidatus Omnitrophota bacterium]